MDTGPKKQLLRFLSEDIRRGDITSALLTKKKIAAKIISRQQGVIAGIKFAKNLFQLKGCNVKAFVKDGAKEFLKSLLLNYSKYWSAITKPKYKNKELSQLSVGMWQILCQNFH